MLYCLNPIFGLLHNVKENRWHPILFIEAPLPGPPESGKSIRLKSKGHHTTGFATREDAIAEIADKAPHVEPPAAIDTEKDIEWDGEDTPAMVAILSEENNVKKLILL